MRIGIDFDNTIILYDKLFHNLALESGLIDQSVPVNKRAVRDAVRAGPRGDIGWQELQAKAYGDYINRAEIAPGFKSFIEKGRAKGFEFFVVSHKTAVSNLTGGGPSLRQAALDWMDAQGFFDPNGLDFKRDNIFFEDVRTKKIERISNLGCSVFIDDLLEVFEERAFPKGVTKVIFTSDDLTDSKDLRVCKSWAEITCTVLDD